MIPSDDKMVQTMCIASPNHGKVMATNNNGL